MFVINKIFFIGLLFIFTGILFGQKNNNPPTTVHKVDLKKYAGLWYEIAKIPNSFQDQCAYGTTAEYKIDEDGDIVVTNKCYDEDGD